MSNRSDNFNRANGAIGTPSDAGGAYTTGAIGGGAPSWVVVSNALALSGSTGNAIAALDSSVSDATVSVVMGGSVSGLTGGAGLVARCSDQNNLVALIHRPADGFAIYSFIAGAGSNESGWQNAGSLSGGETHSLVYFASGNGVNGGPYLQYKVDGTVKASTVNLSNAFLSSLTGTKYGVYSNGETAVTFDDLTITDPAAGPVITGPSGAATGNTTGSGSVNTTGADGTLWRKAATSAQTDPGAGSEAANGWSSTAVSASGAQNVTFTGLTTNTSHVANYLHVSAGGLRSSVATSATFAPPTMASGGTLSAQSGSVSSAFSWTGATPESQIIQQGVGSSAWALTSAGGSGLTTINSSTGVPGGTLTATPGSYTVTVTKTDSSTAGTNPTGGGAPPQTIVRSITVTVSAGADTTPPTLSSASATGGVATCSGSVSTNEANGTLYTVFCASATPPTAVQVEAGQDSAGAAALRAVSQAVSLSGAQTVAAGAISAGTRYAYFMHKDAAGNRSSVVASASITVTAGGVGSFNLNNAIYAFKRKDGVLLTSLGVTFFVNNHLTGDIIGTAITGLSTNASGIVTTPVSNASVVAGTTYRLSWRFSSGEYGQIEMQAA